MKYSQRTQQTLAQPATVNGFGFWSGRDVRVDFRPAGPGEGITFVRRDLKPAVRIPANVLNRIEVPRRTVLSHSGACVEMVEHLLAALAGLQIDNCEVWADAPEMPGCDGSSQPFVDALLQAGIQSQPASRKQLVVTDVTRVADGDTFIEARPAKEGELFVQYRMDYGIEHIIGRQTFRTKIDPETFCCELAPARTFCMLSEAQWLQSQGLGTRTSYQDLLVFDDLQGPIDNQLRFDDECVRHKTLDLLGDLALCGCDLVGRFIAYRSGHRLNAAMVKALLSEGKMIHEYGASA